MGIPSVSNGMAAPDQGCPECTTLSYTLQGGSRAAAAGFGDPQALTMTTCCMFLFRGREFESVSGEQQKGLAQVSVCMCENPAGPEK